MTVSFRAYIDESGDDGFSFRQSLDKIASSDWFVLAAFIRRVMAGTKYLFRRLET
jgi:hypothetical protein